MLDEIFGRENFRREIIWSTGETSGFKGKVKNWVRSHDNILYYTKTDDYIFNKLFIPHLPEYEERFDKSDEKGFKFRDDIPGGRRQYLKDTLGKAYGDVWNIMSFQQASTSSEYVGFPTQKPEALLI